MGLMIMDLFVALIFTAAALSISSILHTLKWQGRLEARGVSGHLDFARLLREGSVKDY
jgi:hypothetical protein